MEEGKVFTGKRTYQQDRSHDGIEEVMGYIGGALVINMTRVVSYRYEE